MSELPEGWVTVYLSDILKKSKEKIEPGKTPNSFYLSLEHVEANTRRIIGRGKATEVSSTKAVFNAGDVLYGKLRPYLNKVCIPDFDGVCSTDFLVFKSSDLVDQRFLMYLLSRRETVQYAHHLSAGVQLPRIGTENLGKLEVPLPPLNEQKRIVAKLDELLPKVEACKERLQKIPTILKRFRQSVLAAAVSGKLTEEWRKDQDISSSDLINELHNSVIERHRGSQVDRGIEKPRKLKEWSKNISPWIEEIPSSWNWTTVGHIATVDIGFAFKSAEFTRSGIRLLRGENIQPGSLRWIDTQYIDEKRLKDFEYLKVNIGDIILAMDRPLISTGLKLARVTEDDTPCLLVQRVARIVAASPVTTDYLEIALLTSSFQEQLIGHTTGSDIPHISGEGICSFSIPLPPLDEQMEIVARVGRLLRTEYELETRLLKGGQYCEKVCQSILKIAFSGILVSQDTTDEPASALLERIKQTTADSQNGNGKTTIDKKKRLC